MTNGTCERLARRFALLAEVEPAIGVFRWNAAVFMLTGDMAPDPSPALGAELHVGC